jgi:hypothetical protein
MLICGEGYNCEAGSVTRKADWLLMNRKLVS